jgi:3-isopropylmalate dehydrogenase
MLLRYSLGLKRAAATVERAVRQVVAAGHRTADIAEQGAPIISTQAMGDAVVASIQGE